MSIKLCLQRCRVGMKYLQKLHAASQCSKYVQADALNIKSTYMTR